ncbi:hypothetical protein PALI_a0106 [Pseudoalteromonas aliena SW19]|uniref:Uncharacterized protein n=1 Tax=Pseudoalteromonas aliena SW19 TaxID=1314866 RepID=A0ABR9DZ55_9GAMM|nr:hypothetical protein [Pseudoalteromonas aliena SW19]
MVSNVLNINACLSFEVEFAACVWFLGKAESMLCGIPHK